MLHFRSPLTHNYKHDSVRHFWEFQAFELGGRATRRLVEENQGRQDQRRNKLAARFKPKGPAQTPPSHKPYRRSYKSHEMVVRIAKRDGDRCWICGSKDFAEQGPRRRTVDHVIPLSHPDGTNSFRNLALAHEVCNQRRGNKLISRQPV